MSGIKTFLHDAETAGANVALAFENLERGMLWDQAIAEATPAQTTPRRSNHHTPRKP